MRASYAALAASAAQLSMAASLADVCTVFSIQDSLPANGTLLGIDLLSSTVTAAPVYNATIGGGGMMKRGRKRQTPGTGTDADVETYDYCNVTVSYTHTGKGDNVALVYAFPAPKDFASRFYVAGGGGFSLSSDATGGLAYGAASGATDAGYDGFSNSYDEVVLYSNGSTNWDATYMFGYQALGEMTKIGKAIAKNLYDPADNSKIYTYYEGCSDGGREGMSQVQRYGDEYDGVIAGAPAFRFAQQQVLHVFSAAVEHTMDYFPPPCEMALIVNKTIEACDPLDGKTDGVVSRTDLCKLSFNLDTIIGESYSCEEQTSTPMGFSFDSTTRKRQVGGGGSSYQPAQNGTVSKEGIAVAKAIYEGLLNSKGERAYLSWQIASDLGDATTTWNNETEKWELSIPSTGGEYVTKFVQLLDLDNLSNLDGVTYDTLVEWMKIGMYRYEDSLQTTLPDLTTFKESGGKLLHYHGESDSSIPAGSSVHYWQSVRSVMYPDTKDDHALRDMSEWYQFYLVPGAGHCGSNSLQPNGPYPQDNMDTMIAWVEGGVQPSRLNATVAAGEEEGVVEMLCQWPQRPLWKNDEMDCVEDKKSIDSWTYEFNAFKTIVY